MVKNKKIKNATKTVFNGIKFKSKLEESFYKTLTQAGFKVEYEKYKFTLIDGFTPTVPFYNRNKAKVFNKEMSKIRAITYTPDFVIRIKDTFFIIEAKGKENDTYAIKRKLFRKYLEYFESPSVFFEVHTKKELFLVIDIIKSYGTTPKQDKETVKRAPRKGH